MAEWSRIASACLSAIAFLCPEKRCLPQDSRGGTHPCIFCDPATLPQGLHGASACVSQVEYCSEKLEVAKSAHSWMQYMPKKFRPKEVMSGLI